MKRNILIGILAFVVFGISSCKKKDVILEESNSPVFRAEGTIGNESLNLIAGDNNAYMFTSTESENGVQVFSGNLSDGITSVELGIYNGKLDFPDHIPVQNFDGISVFSMNAADTLAVLSKNLMPNNLLISEVEWYINNSFAGINEVAITKPGKYNICAMVTFLDATTESLCNEMILGYQLAGNGKINHFLGQSGELVAWINEISGDVNEVRWYIDDILINTTHDSQSFKYILNAGRHKLKAIIRFESGSVLTKSVLLDGDLQGKFIEDFTIFQNSSNMGVFRDFNVRLKITKNNQEYRSDETDNNDAAIILNSINYYGTNTIGKKVYKVNGSIKANVKNVSTNAILPVDLNIVFGIEVP